MFALSKGNHIVDCGGKVNNSSITDSTIDMNGGVITSHGTPLNSLDVVNKAYVDSAVTSSVLTTVVTLSGNSYVSIPLSILTGQIRLSIKNIITDGPSASFEIAKSSDTSQAAVSRISSIAGITSYERLELQWLPGSTIQIRKTNINYDGDYKIKLFLND